MLTAACVEKEKAVELKKVRTGQDKAVGLDIASIMADAQAYRDKEVTVSGKAQPGLAFEFVTEQPYLLDDGTGQIWVITTGLMPEQDAWGTVTGTVKVPYQIKGRRFEVAIFEAKRQ